MSPMQQRLKGKVEQVGGAIQKVVGKAVGNVKLEARGEAKEDMGVARQTVARAGERLKGAGDALEGAVKSVAGKVLGNERMQVEGAAKKLEGAARKRLNR